MLIVHFYRVTIRHSTGRVRIHTTASTPEQAARQVAEFEGAPMHCVTYISATTFTGDDLPADDPLQIDAQAATLETRNADHPCPSWSEGVEAKRLRKRAAFIRAGMIA